MADRIGEPPRLGPHPGAVTRRLSVVRITPAASPLPTAEPIGHNVRSAMSTPIATSTTPGSEETRPRS
jgi:hypothetical protein